MDIHLKFHQIMLKAILIWVQFVWVPFSIDIKINNISTKPKILLLQLKRNINIPKKYQNTPILKIHHLNLMLLIWSQKCPNKFVEAARQLFIAYFRTNNSRALKHSASAAILLEIVHWQSFRLRFNDFSTLRSSGKSLFTFAQCCNLCQEVVCRRTFAEICIQNIYIELRVGGEWSMLCDLNTKFVPNSNEFWVFAPQSLLNAEGSFSPDISLQSLTVVTFWNDFLFSFLISLFVCQFDLNACWLLRKLRAKVCRLKKGTWLLECWSDVSSALDSMEHFPWQFPFFSKLRISYAKVGHKKKYDNLNNF